MKNFWLRRLWLGLLLWLGLGAAHALAPADALAVADGELSDRVAAVQRLAASRDPRAAELIRALADERVKFAGDRVYIVNGPTDTEATDALTGQSAIVLQKIPIAFRIQQS